MTSIVRSASGLSQIFLVTVTLCCGCTDIGSFPDCSSDPASLSAPNFRFCYTPTIIGKNEDSVFVQEPFLTTGRDTDQFAKRLYQISLDGNVRLIHEFDFDPNSLTTNGQLIAWLTDDAARVIVRDTSSGNEWTAWENTSGAYDVSLQMNSRALVIQPWTEQQDGAMSLIDLDSQSELISVDVGMGYVSAISEDWIAFNESQQTGDTTFNTRIRLIELDTLKILDITDLEPANITAYPIIDAAAMTIYWAEYDSIDESSNAFPASRLMRWDYSSKTTSIIDPAFSAGSGNLGIGPGGIPLGPVDFKVLLDAGNGYISGFHITFKPPFEYHSNLYIQSESGNSQEVSTDLKEYPAIDGPRIVQGKLIWLDCARMNLMVFDPVTSQTNTIAIIQ